MIHKENSTIDSIIEGLTNDLKPVTPLRHPVWRGMVWLVFVALYYSVFVALTDFDLNIDETGHHPEFMYELISLSVLGVSASLASFYLCLPDVKERLWIVAIPLVLLANFIVWLGIMGMGDIFSSSHQDMEWSHCFEGGLYLAGIPAAIMIMMARKGTTTHPVLLGGMNMLSVASLSSIVLRLCCSETSLAHISVFHVLPFLLLGAFVGLFARRIYRW